MNWKSREGEEVTCSKTTRGQAVECERDGACLDVCARRGGVGIPSPACTCTEKTKGCPDLERKLRDNFTILTWKTFRFFCAGACDRGGVLGFLTGKSRLT